MHRSSPESKAATLNNRKAMAMNKTLKFGDSKLRWGALEAMDALTQVNT